MRGFARLIAISCLVLCAAPPSRAEHLILSPGHQRVLSAPGIVRASIGDPQVADVSTLTQTEQVIITAKSPGNTNLYLWSGGGDKILHTISVRLPPRDVGGDIGKLLDGIEGIEIRTWGGRVFLDGDLYRGEDLDRVERVARLHTDVVNLTRMNAGALAYLAGRAQALLSEAGIENVIVRAAGDKLFLEGTAGTNAEIERAERIASTVFPRLANHIAQGVEMGSLVLIDVKMMEVRSNRLGHMGVNWPHQIDASGQLNVTRAGANPALNVGQGATVSLQALMETGAAKLLSNPKLLCRSGTPASFLAGGQIPIRLIGERFAEVVFKSYGVSLEVTAVADASNNVMLEVETTVSDIDPANAVDGIPGFLENKVKTAANLRFGDTVVLGGLIQDRARKNVQKLPILGHIPILGEIFKSRAFQRNESEFLVFLTPLPGGPGSPFNRAPIQDMNKGMENAADRVRLSILD